MASLCAKGLAAAPAGATLRPSTRLNRCRAAVPARSARRSLVCKAVVGDGTPLQNGTPLPRAGETAAEMDARRLRESERVESRTQYVNSLEELEAFLVDAGDKLVFLGVESADECDLSDYPDPSDVQRTVSDSLMQPCVRVRHTLARVARECDDAVFLTLAVSEDREDLAQVAASLGVTRFPTYQYYKHGELLWEHTGAGQLTNQSIGEGMLYYGGQAAGGAHASEFITEVSSARELAGFLELCAAPQETAMGVHMDVPCEKQLAILDVSTSKDSPACIHVFPAVLALAKNTAGACRWARCLADWDSQTADLAEALAVTSVPTFIFFNGEQEVGRYVGSDRLELMNAVLQTQKNEGFALPERKPRKRVGTAEAKRIAREARARNKASQWN